jgi:MFS family permease
VLTGPRRQLDLLGRAPSFRLFFLATLSSGLGTWLAVVALTIDVFDRTQSAKWVSALLIADFLPSVAIGLLFGPLIDRFSRRGLMIAADLARCAVFVALPFADSATAIVALTAVVGFATGFFRPASYAGLPNLVGESDLAAANSLVRSGEYLSIMVGTLLGGVITAASGPEPAYWANAVTFLFSAALLARIPARLLQASRAASRGHWRDVGEGFALVFRSRPLLAVFVSWNLIMLANAAVNVSEVVLAKVSFDAGDLGFGLMWAASGLGLALGSLYASPCLEHRGLPVVYAAAMGLMALGALAAAVSPSVWVAIWCIALGGAGNGAAVVYNSLLVQRGAPDELRGRVFTVIMGTNFAFLGVGMIAAGPLTDAFGARWVFAGAACIAGLAAVVGYVLAHGVPAQPAQEETEPLVAG